MFIILGKCALGPYRTFATAQCIVRPPNNVCVTTLLQQCYQAAPRGINFYGHTVHIVAERMISLYFVVIISVFNLSLVLALRCVRVYCQWRQAFDPVHVSDII